jgi:hypothetical protein
VVTISKEKAEIDAVHGMLDRNRRRVSHDLGSTRMPFMILFPGTSRWIMFIFLSSMDKQRQKSQFLNWLFLFVAVEQFPVRIFVESA